MNDIHFKFYLEDMPNVTARSVLLGIDPIVIIEPSGGDLIVHSSLLTKGALALIIEVLNEYMDNEDFWKED